MTTSAPTALDRTFTALLRQSPARGGWTCAVLPEIAKRAGDEVTVHLEERLS